MTAEKLPFSGWCIQRVFLISKLEMEGHTVFFSVGKERLDNFFLPSLIVFFDERFPIRNKISYCLKPYKSKVPNKPDGFLIVPMNSRNCAMAEPLF